PARGRAWRARPGRRVVAVRGVDGIGRRSGGGPGQFGGARPPSRSAAGPRGWQPARRLAGTAVVPAVASVAPAVAAVDGRWPRDGPVVDRGDPQGRVLAAR